MCSRLAQYHDDLLQNDVVVRLWMIRKRDLNILFPAAIALEFPVTYGQNFKDEKLRAHSCQNA